MHSLTLATIAVAYLYIGGFWRMVGLVGVLVAADYLMTVAR